MSDMSEVQALAGAGTAVEFRSERLEIQPLRFGQALEIIAAAAPLVEGLVAYASQSGLNDDIVFFTGMLAKHGDQVPRVLAIASGRDAEFIKGGDLAETLELCGTVYEVNRDFFDQRLAPLFARWRARLQGPERSDGAGPTPSTS